MGCSSTDTYPDLGFLKPCIIDNNLSTLMHQENICSSLGRVNDIMLSITKISKKVISSYYNLLYQSGACVFIHPQINHCFLCIFNKIALDLDGKMELANVKYLEDPPYISIDMKSLAEDTKIRFKAMLDFVIEFHSFNSIIEQIDKDIPELYYVVFEQSELELTDESKKRMMKSIDVFQQTKKTCYEVYTAFRLEVQLYFYRNESMNGIFKRFRERANQLNLKDIYDIAMLNNELSKVDNEILYMPMYSSVAQAKKVILKLIKDGGESLSSDLANTK